MSDSKMSSFEVEIVRIHPGDAAAIKRTKRGTKISVPPGATVSDLKKRYLQHSPKRDWIKLDLCVEGTEGTTQLRDDVVVQSALKNGARLTYESVVMTPDLSPAREARTHRIPPFSLSSSSNDLQRRLNDAAAEMPTSKPPEFVASDATVFAREYARALVVSDGTKTSHRGKDEAENDDAHHKLWTARTVSAHYETRVRNCVFSTIHRMEGLWSGESVIVSHAFRKSDNDENVDALSVRRKPSVSNARVDFDTAKQMWTVQRRTTSPDGITEDIAMHMSPVSDGVLQVQQTSNLMPHASFRVSETARGILSMTGVDRETGRLVYVETTTIVDENHRVRTSQEFARDGSLTSCVVTHETRLISATTGALVVDSR
eukprot:g1730.t1